MSAQSVPVFAPLPPSHFFLTVSRGTGMRTFAVRVVLVYLVAGLLPLLALIGAGATAYIAFHDDIVASLMARQGQMQYAYEDRLDAMRGELQRQSVRASSDRATIENRLHDLLSRESKLETRAELVASLANLTGFAPARPLTAGLSVPGEAGNPLVRWQTAPPALPSEALGYDAAVPSDLPARIGPQKPHPEADPVSPSARPAGLPETLSSIDSTGLPLTTTLALASASLDKVEQKQVGALLRIGAAAHDETSRLEATLEEVGLSPDRFRRATISGQGGPFVPLPADRDSPFGLAMTNLQDMLSAAVHLRASVARVPLADPLPGQPEVTSPFGARVDPFLGRAALHTGVDLRENFGADVKATAAGRVAFAGSAGGYGNMVEIDHGNGLVTRYAHLEEILVANGTTVDRDTIVGRVGSTGRATGPHLHYEIRVDNEPVDPVRYLNVGLRSSGLQVH